VASLRGADTCGISVLDEKSGAAMWRWLDVESRKEGHGPPPKEKLAPMLDLYKRAKREKFLPQPLPRDSIRDRDIRLLNGLRNNFIHFVPIGWSVELSGLPRIVGSCCKVFRHLGVDHLTFEHHFKGTERSRIQSAIESLDASSPVLAP
jgi:hypothetical protein